MQLEFLHKRFDALQLRYGDPSLRSIYGAGCITRPRVMFVFMNPTARNVSARKEWRGLRAPWLGTKSIWGMFRELGLLSENVFGRIQAVKPEAWTADFAREVYRELEGGGVFVTNLAKCTQRDARPLGNGVFKKYIGLMLEEIASLRPHRIIAFGNQVSSILLRKAVSVGGYVGADSEMLEVAGVAFKVYPTYYPVGQGRRNLPLAIARIKKALRS